VLPPLLVLRIGMGVSCTNNKTLYLSYVSATPYHPQFPPTGADMQGGQCGRRICAEANSKAQPKTALKDCKLFHNFKMAAL